MFIDRINAICEEENVIDTIGRAYLMGTKPLIIGVGIKSLWEELISKKKG